MNYLIENWMPILAGILAIAKVIVNLTPSENDNKIFAVIDNLVDKLVPNLKKGGDVHTNSIIKKKSK